MRSPLRFVSAKPKHHSRSEHHCRMLHLLPTRATSLQNKGAVASRRISDLRQPLCLLRSKKNRAKPKFSLCSKIVTAIVAIINSSSIWKPSLRLPNMALSRCFMYDCHPPIIAYENHHTNYPFAHDPHTIPNAKQNHIQATMLTGFIRQLYFCTTTFGTFYINRHNITPFCFILFYTTLWYLSIFFGILSYNIFEVIKWNP